MWQQILCKWRMSHLTACMYLWVVFLKNHEINGISDRYFSKSHCCFSCVINANSITNPLPLQFGGTVQWHRHLQWFCWWCSTVIPRCVVVQRIREPCRELCTSGLWWTAVSSAQVLFGIPCFSNSSCSVFHTELSSWFSFCFALPPALLYPSKSTFNCRICS